ncbi:MAG: hypothetical protein AB7I42_19110 [Bradyrhizobium sp.]|uniref:hypothetical protein n=1 Tax=Bradyrhizobium sp. TaxID=376 RepID=UPI003D1036DF
MQYKTDNPFKSALPALAILILSGCGGQGVCDDTEVLKTVKKLYTQQTLGQFIEPPEGAFAPQATSATLVSSDKQSNLAKCSVLVRVDYVVLAKMIQKQKMTDKEIKDNAEKRGVPAFEDFLVNYQVQSLASGQNYVTVLP